MRHSNWLIPLGAAASVAALAWLVPAHDIYARLYRPQLTRQEAIKTARLLTKEYGVNTGDWSWAVTSETRGQQSDALSVYPESAVLQSLNPFSLRVLATAPNGDMILTTLGPSGRPVAYQHRLTIAPRPPGPGPVPRPGPPRGNSPGTPPPGPPPRPPDPPRPPPELLERELARYAGSNSGSFRPTTSGVTSQEGTRTVWEWADPGKPGILARFELVTRDGTVVRAAYSDEIAFRLMVRERHRQQLIIGTLIGAMIGIASLIAFLAVWNFFSRMTLRMDHVRFGLPLCLVAGASILPDWLSGNATNLAAFAPLDGAPARRRNSWGPPPQRAHCFGRGADTGLRLCLAAGSHQTALGGAEPGLATQPVRLAGRPRDRAGRPGAGSPLPACFTFRRQFRAWRGILFRLPCRPSWSTRCPRSRRCSDSPG